MNDSKAGGSCEAWRRLLTGHLGSRADSLALQQSSRGGRATVPVLQLASIHLRTRSS